VVQWSQIPITLMRSRIRICIKMMRIRNLGFLEGKKSWEKANFDKETVGNAFLAAPAETGKCWWHTAPGSRTTARYLVSANKKEVHIFIVILKYRYRT
jgi:hypothetical protein